MTMHHRDGRVGEVRATSEGTYVFPLSSETPYRRRMGNEILVHSDEAVDLSFLNSGNAPLGLGNFDDIYLLRACAAWGWRRGDPDALATVLAFREPLARRLRTLDQGDPGPPGFCFTFLHLAERDGVIALPPLPSWDAICVGLESQGYFIELAAFACLMGHAELSADYLERFQRQRELLPGVSFPDWLLDGALADWRGICESRAAFELEVLTSPNPCDPAHLARQGLLPL